MLLAFWISVTIMGWGMASFVGKPIAAVLSAPYLMWLRSIITVGLLLPIVWVQRSGLAHAPTTWQTWLLVFLAAAFTAVAVIGFYNSLRLGQASVVVPITATYPVLTALLAALFLGEHVTPIRALGIVLTVLGVALVTR